MSLLEIEPTQVRDLAPEVMGDDGRMRILPASYWAETTMRERVLFGHRHGVYSFPTVELVDHLRGMIGDRTAIEIGAGHGVLAEALGIPATDNRMQEDPHYAAIYAAIRQPPVRYGPNVIQCHASQAVRRFKPQVVIGCWVTHKYDPNRHAAGGNEIGIDEIDVLLHCEQYIIVGNEHVHSGKKLWDLPHHIEYPAFAYSRAHNGTRDFIATWQRRGDRPRSR